MNKYWFRRRKGLFTKDVGWGWIPISWEGWTTLGVSLGLIGLLAYVLGLSSEYVDTMNLVIFFTTVVLVVAAAAFVASHKTHSK